jgi:hypothetical protein
VSLQYNETLQYLNDNVFSNVKTCRQIRIHLYQTIRCYIPEDITPQFHSCDNNIKNSIGIFTAVNIDIEVLETLYRFVPNTQEEFTVSIFRESSGITYFLEVRIPLQNKMTA